MFVFFFSCITLHRLSACRTLWSICQRFLIFRCLAGDLETSICVWMQLPFLCIGIVISIKSEFFSPSASDLLLRSRRYPEPQKRLKLHISVFSIDQLPFLRSTSIKMYKAELLLHYLLPRLSHPDNFQKLFPGYNTLCPV